MQSKEESEHTDSLNNDGLASLPSELLISILEHLSFRTLLRLRIAGSSRIRKLATAVVSTKILSTRPPLTAFLSSRCSPGTPLEVPFALQGIDFEKGVVHLEEADIPPGRAEFEAKLYEFHQTHQVPVTTHGLSTNAAATHAMMQTLKHRTFLTFKLLKDVRMLVFCRSANCCQGIIFCRLFWRWGNSSTSDTPSMSQYAREALAVPRTELRVVDTDANLPPPSSPNATNSQRPESSPPSTSPPRGVVVARTTHSLNTSWGELGDVRPGPASAALSRLAVTPPGVLNVSGASGYDTLPQVAWTKDGGLGRTGVRDGKRGRGGISTMFKKFAKLTWNMVSGNDDDLRRARCKIGDSSYLHLHFFPFPDSFAVIDKGVWLGVDEPIRVEVGFRFLATVMGEGGR
ncbi:hypothetical protein M427DRAFT_156078 [Gonapodya prolifera JEL478]|uniref:F-box domain-containing protein n=1 Tax=Gonapodya prolifera (strain JEL478) TaxID=1344416 RepID=A0A139AC47_GONPJ|nr:hypothetical protein M427DRAFT_156078 [Gonapodya prolifera JEL478]|eukprot:KXS14308.1 hypothetical protein M427DRAFT_156078 [Gonapodya prolifera JEL478]